MPYVQSMLQKYFQKQVCKSLDPDQAVAYGAAICAAKATGNVTAEVCGHLSLSNVFDLSHVAKKLQLRHFQIRDVIPLSLGVETKGGIMSVIVKRNVEFPTKQYGSYATTSDFQTTVTISVSGLIVALHIGYPISRQVCNFMETDKLMFNSSYL